MPGINQLGGALAVPGSSGQSLDVAGGANQEAQGGVEPVPNDAVKAVREVEPAPKESQDDSSVKARQEARRFADLSRSGGRADPETGDVIAISPEARARSVGEPSPPEQVEERPVPEDPDRPSSVRGEPVRRFDDLFAKGYRRDDDVESERIEQEPEKAKIEKAPQARPETTQVEPEEPVRERRISNESNDLPDESVSEISDAS